MGKKGSWFSALKRVFAPSSKQNASPSHVLEKRNFKDKKKWGLNKLKQGDSSSFIPLYKEPSSVEKILGDAEREYLRHGKHQTVSSLPSRDLFHRTSPPLPQLPALPPAKVENKQPNRTQLPPPPPQKAPFERPITRIRPAQNSYHELQSAAIKIQAAYRGYAARRSSRLLKGLMRLQKMMRGQSVKRQTVNAMKCMQWVVRVRTQVHSRRIEMMESRASHRQQKAQYNEQETILSTWSQTPPQSEKDKQVHEEWDDSQLTKDEINARLQRKAEAVMKRGKALAYAYSHQHWKATPKTVYEPTKVIRSEYGLPHWWNWIDRELALPNPNIMTIPTRTNKQSSFNLTMSNTIVHPTPNLSPARHTKAKATIAEIMPKTPGRDDESMTSCPPFSVPNYMTPTASAKAKVRTYVGSPKEKPDGTAQPKKRMSFGQTIGSLKWGKGTSNMFNRKNLTSQGKGMDTIDNVSVDSALSLPVGLGRKPFKFK